MAAALRRALSASVLASLAFIMPARGATIAYYRFENGAPGTTGGVVVDSSGNGLNGTANGPVYRTDVPVETVRGQPNGQSMEFNGLPKNYVNIPENPLFVNTFPHSFTVEAFINPRPYPGVSGDVVFRGDDRVAHDSWSMNLNDGELRFRIFAPDGSNSLLAYPDAGLYGHWSHIAGTIDDATGRQSLYVDGVLVASTVTNIRALGPLDPNFSPGIGIGHTQLGNYNQGFSGWIDEVRISNEALLPGQFLPEPSAAAFALTAVAASQVRPRRRSK
jgi:hypothetical protein